MQRNNRSKRHDNNRQRLRGKRPNQQQRQQSADQVVKLHQHIVPDKILVPLRYYWPTVILNNAGVRNASHQLRINAPFNVDATLGTINASGFTEWATLYQKYRVHSVEIKAVFNNLDAVPTFCAVQLSTVSYATNALTQAFWQNDFTKWRSLGQSTGNDYSKDVLLNHSMKQLVGDPAAETDDDYAALVTGVPNILLYCNFAIDSGAAAITMTIGSAVRIEVTMHTYFFNRQPFQG